MFIAVLLIITQNWNNQKTGNRQASFNKENKLWYSHTMAYYSAIKILIHVTT